MPGTQWRTIYKYNYLIRRHGLLLSFLTDANYVPNLNTRDAIKMRHRNNCERQEDEKEQAKSVTSVSTSSTRVQVIP